MPAPQGAAEPARFILLGLLAEGPRHGYDLTRAFGPRTALSEVVRLSPSHLYALLGRLERDRLIEGEREEAGAYPPRHVYHLTDAGREAVMRWIDEPVTHPRDMRIDFPLKLYLARRLDPRCTASLVERQRHILLAHIDVLEGQRIPEGEGDDGAFIALMRDGRIGRLRAALDWLDRCAQREPVPDCPSRT